MTEELPLCECGCGEPVTKKGNRFICGHNKNRLGTGKPKPEAQLCECGCGELAKPGNRFIFGHANRGRKHSQKTKNEISNTKKQFHIDNPEIGKSHSKFMIQRFIDNPEIGRDHSAFMIEYYKDQNNLDAQSKRITEYFANHPEAKEAARLKSLEQWSDQEFHDMMVKIAIERFATQEACDAHSEILINSAGVEAMRGGNDLVWHHVAYDFGRPDALRVRITRKFHGQIHSPKGQGVHQRGYSLID